LLYIAEVNNGIGGYGAKCYISEAVVMGKSVQLFGFQGRKANSKTIYWTEKARYAFSQTAWGVFNVLS
jgi:hypothetical protein